MEIEDGNDMFRRNDYLSGDYLLYCDLSFLEQVTTDKVPLLLLHHSGIDLRAEIHLLQTSQVETIAGWNIDRFARVFMTGVTQSTLFLVERGSSVL